MNERSEAGGQPETSPRLLVAVRTMDRRTLISPTQATPDLFEVAMTPEPIGLENRVARDMRDNHGIVVNSDHSLSIPEEDRPTLGYAVYQRHTVDYEKAGSHGLFTPHEVNIARQELLEWSHDTSDVFSEEEKRLFRIKAHLFHQVLVLFSDRGLRRPR
jgi:hypothetical protein